MLDFFKLRNGGKDFFLIVLLCSFIIFSLGQLILLVEPYIPSSSNTKEVTTTIVDNKEVKIELTLNKDKEIIKTQVVK